MARKSNKVYTENYQELCFQAWYSAGRPKKVSDALEVIPADVDDRKPGPTMVEKWLNETWMLRADELDAKAVQLADNNLIAQKAEMLKAQAERGRELQEKGIEYIRTSGYDSAASAVQGVIRGAELERTSRGIGELIVKMSKMSEGDLKEEIMRRLQILSDDTAVDATVEEEQEDIEDKAD